ncbi:phosphoglucosamine mutase [Algisphaera agarilytica]|uniref:Phosphomannomutase n=1 Tax=Algisphaera agarilytica TaxID=1385975 RepID=A0A7X0LJU1_9BACT|nr:phosphoglucosamine mutase [Algisphaera agarilytica]MBB6429735.1 phosphomannomutase [Algisphaera agarilytica]
MADSNAPLMLSISGMRGLVGKSITPDVVARYTAAFGSWLKTARNTANPTVVLGRDSRPSGEMFENAAAAGLASIGAKVIRVGILSTPGVAIMGQHLGADGGIVITASHNPTPWNGVKPLRHDGVAPPPDAFEQFIAMFKSDEADHVEVDALKPITSNTTGVEVHRDLAADLVDVELIRNAKLKAVVDSVHGAGGDEAAALLDLLGVETVQLYKEPTGQFPHVPEPTKENLTELCEVVAREGAHVGFAQDPDADRLAIVDEQGQYIGEEYTLALCAMHKLGKGDVAVANLSTSRMIDDIAEAAGATVVRTPVGEANVAAGMRANNANLGGEGNGGIIWRPISQVRDSLVGMALVLEMLAQRKISLSSIVAATPSYAIVKDKLELPTREQADPTLVWTAQHYADQKVDTQDGVRVDWEDRWVHVRPSNTEPILRIIAEAATQEAAQALVDEVRAGIASIES